MAKRGYKAYNPGPENEMWLGYVNEILRQYHDDLPLTIRQIFYRLVAQYNYPKDERAYKKLVGMIGLARRASPVSSGGGVTVPFDAIRDDSMRVIEPHFYDDEGDFWEVIEKEADRLKLDRQDGQEQIVEFWCEAAGIVPILTQIADPYSVRVNSCGGYDSVTAKHKLAIRARDRWKERKLKTIVAHVGDFDPSGEDMANVLHEDVLTMVYQWVRDEAAFEVRRLALTPDQVIDYQVITAPPKPSDSRMENFLREHEDLAVQLGTDDISAQLEALTPTQLRQLFTDFIEDTFDMAVYDERLNDERELREILAGKLEELRA